MRHLWLSFWSTFPQSVCIGELLSWSDPNINTFSPWRTGVRRGENRKGACCETITAIHCEIKSTFWCPFLNSSLGGWHLWHSLKTVAKSISTNKLHLQPTKTWWQHVYSFNTLAKFLQRTNLYVTRPSHFVVFGASLKSNTYRVTWGPRKEMYSQLPGQKNNYWVPCIAE